MSTASAIGRKMAVQAFLRRPVVVARDREHRIGAHLLGVAAEHDRFGRRVGARAGDHRHAAIGFLDADFHDPHMLFVAESRRFARRSAGDEAVAALFDLPGDQVSECALVYLPVLHGCDECGN